MMLLINSKLSRSLLQIIVCAHLNENIPRQIKDSDCARNLRIWQVRAKRLLNSYLNFKISPDAIFLICGGMNRKNE